MGDLERQVEGVWEGSQGGAGEDQMSEGRLEGEKSPRAWRGGQGEPSGGGDPAPPPLALEPGLPDQQGQRPLQPHPQLHRDLGTLTSGPPGTGDHVYLFTGLPS